MRSGAGLAGIGKLLSARIIGGASPVIRGARRSGRAGGAAARRNAIIPRFSGSAAQRPNRGSPARSAASRRGWYSMAKTAAAAPAAPKKARVLTEEEILKAPEKDYMNEAQLAFFRQRLMDLRDQLLQNADDTGEHLRENEVTTDPSDRATLEEEYTLELRTRDRERKLLKKVEKSIKQIDDGSYGFCEETGEPIGVPRLLARPTATLSLEAQERRERVQKLYGD
ncbi:MAG: RNA polymerase-binding protein DksA [Proteobacteria bacterium]|nr:RNA polymerase-binding protein DksA [Pseudomonadota bacterium]